MNLIGEYTELKDLRPRKEFNISNFQLLLKIIIKKYIYIHTYI